MKIVIMLVIVRYSYQFLIYNIPTNNTEFDIMLERMSNILSNCQTDEMNYIGLCWSSEIPEDWSIKFMRNIPTIKLKILSDINEIFYPRDIYYNNSFRYDKLHVFILFISSPSNLRRLIEKLMASIWWNPLAFYAIIDSTVKICDQPEAYLSTTWNFDLELSAFFCVDSDKAHTVYTYNHYGNPAPRAWHMVESSIDKEYRTWEMLKYNLQNDTTCDNLNFNKKIKVGGYRIKMIGGISPPTLTFDPQRKDMEKYGGMDGLILSTLFSKMNASILVTMLDKNAKIHPLLRNVSNNEYDMLMNAQYIFNKQNYTMTYPHIDSGISTLTRPRGFDSNETKILKFLSPQLIIGLLAVAVVTVFILVALTGLGLSSACLEVLRITINASVLHFPQGAPLRIYLVTVILLFLITGWTFQSSLSSILTSSTSKPDIDNNDALKRAGYPIYMFSGYKNAISDHVLRSRVRETDRWDCSRYVIDYPNTACVADRNRLMRIAFENNLYVSKHRITNLYMGYVMRPNFPLVRRIGRMLMAMSQSGLIDYWRVKTVAVYRNRWKMKEQEMKRNKYRAMNVSDLLFAFYILLFGLCVSVLTFLLELLIQHWRKSCMVLKKRK